MTDLNGGPESSDPTKCSGDEGFCPEHGFHRHSLKQPGADPQFGIDGCTCIPWTRKYGAPRRCGPRDTVADIGGWGRGIDCPHHEPPTAPSVSAASDLRTLIRGVIRDCPARYPDDIADRVVDALPVAADRAELEQLRTENERMRHELEVMYGGAFNSPNSAPADADLRDRIEVWPLKRVLVEVRCGSQDWSWDEEWADLDKRHAETGYLAKLEQEIRENGIIMPVLIGSDGRLWDGHHRLRIAVRLGIEYVPVDLTPAAIPEPRRPFDVRAGLQRLADDLQRGERRLDAVPTPADRAAVLREAADAIDATFTGRCQDRYVRYGADLLRRMANEVRQADTAGGA